MSRVGLRELVLIWVVQRISIKVDVVFTYSMISVSSVFLIMLVSQLGIAVPAEPIVPLLSFILYRRPRPYR